MSKTVDSTQSANRERPLRWAHPIGPIAGFRSGGCLNGPRSRIRHYILGTPDAARRLASGLRSRRLENASTNWVESGALGGNAEESLETSTVVPISSLTRNA